VPTFADTGYRVVSAVDPYGSNLGFLERIRYFFIQVAPQFADTGYRVVSAVDPYGCNLGFLDRIRYFFIQVAPQLYS
jgi:hypothetical protein